MDGWNSSSPPPPPTAASSTKMMTLPHRNHSETTSVNRFDPSLVKQGYYYLLTLPYKGAGTLKDAPQASCRKRSLRRAASGIRDLIASMLNLSKKNYQNYFIQNATKLYKNTLESVQSEKVRKYCFYQ